MARLLSLLLVTLCWRQPCCSATVFHAVDHRSRQPTKSAQPASLPEALHGAASQQDSDVINRRRRLLRSYAARDATVGEAPAAAAADEEDALAAGDPEQAEEAEVQESGEGGDEYQFKTPDGEDTEAEKEDVAERVFPNVEDAEGYRRLKCDRFQVTYKQIDHDLAIHRELGTHLGSTQYAMTEQRRKNGFGIGFFGGRAYLLTPIRGEDWQRLAHHAKLYVAYLRMMTHLEAVFGAAIPDVVLVITTSDTPRYVSPLRVNVSTPRPYPPQRAVHMPTFVPGPYPVAGICKSDFWPDLLLIPNFHFHTKLYDNATLSHIPEHRDKHPWGSRQPVVFGRFSHYSLHRKSDDHSTFKLGLGGQHICQEGNTSCAVREHFISEVVKKDRARRLDVRFSGKQPMSSHARYKYLINLSGQSISSRLEQLLPLGSAVLTEPTSVGYYAYYYRTLLRHRVNVLEFWRRLPEEVFEELDWAAAHDEEAAAIAAEGVRTAETHLTGNGRTCYWYRLLHGLSRTLRFTPHLGQWPEAVPVRQLLEEDLPQAPGGQALAEAPWAP